MNKREAILESTNLVKMSNIINVGSCDHLEYPNIKAMLLMGHEGLKTFYFSTNTSSKRVAQFKINPKACLYFVDPEERKGLMLTGKIEILQDKESKENFWKDGFEKYYRLGVEDPDYSILRFTAIKGNYYHNLHNVDFELDEVEELKI